MTHVLVLLLAFLSVPSPGCVPDGPGRGLLGRLSAGSTKWNLGILMAIS